eukprot:gene24729-10365_t
MPFLSAACSDIGDRNSARMRLKLPPVQLAVVGRVARWKGNGIFFGYYTCRRKIWAHVLRPPATATADDVSSKGTRPRPRTMTAPHVLAAIDSTESNAEAKPGFESECAPKRSEAALRWHRAYRKVRVMLIVCRAFGTLRDQHGLNEIKLSQLKTISKLGEGAFATVEKCLYTPASGDAKEVAVKKLKADVMKNTTDVQSFYDEVRLLRKLDHPNIMRYVGIGYVDASSEKTKRETMFLACEMMQGGTLRKLVMNQMLMPHKSLFTLATALKWCINIADALAYLHSSQPKVIHRDLKLENILLKGGVTHSTQVACLADFGLAAFVRKEIIHPPKPKMTKVASHMNITDYDMGAAAMMERMDPCSSGGGIQRKATGLLDALEQSVRGGANFFNPSTRGGSHYNGSIKGGNLFSGSLRGGNNFNPSGKGGNHFNPSGKGGNNFNPSAKGGNNYTGSLRGANNFPNNHNNPSQKGGNSSNHSAGTSGGGIHGASAKGGHVFFNAENLPLPKALLSGKTGSLMYMSPEMFRNERGCVRLWGVHVRAASQVDVFSFGVDVFSFEVCMDRLLHKYRLMAAGIYLLNEHCPPCAVLQVDVFSFGVDVFSFGVCMYELLHKYCMFFAISHEGTEEEIERYAQNVSEGYRPPIHELFPAELKLLMADCWAQDPKERPCMSLVAERLRAIQDEGALDGMGGGGNSGCCVVC